MIIGKTRDKIINITPIKDTNNLQYAPDSVIRSTEVISNLKSIAERYDDELKKKAKAYAEESVPQSEFDSDEEILSKAKESLDEIYGEKRTTATEKMQRNLAELTSEKSGYETERSRSLRKVGDSYERKEGKLAEKLSKEGITHSSIAGLAKDALGKERSQEQDRVNALYDSRIANVDSKLERLSRSHEDALRNYEITYAVQLEKEIASLKAKRDRLESEYAKEHSDDRDKAYDHYLINDRKENAEYEAREGDYTGAKKENYSERYDYLVGELKGKSKKSIQNFISSNEYTLREYLGLYYDKFVKEVS